MFFFFVKHPITYIDFFKYFLWLCQYATSRLVFPIHINRLVIWVGFMFFEAVRKNKFYISHPASSTSLINTWKIKWTILSKLGEIAVLMSTTISPSLLKMGPLSNLELLVVTSHLFLLYLLNKFQNWPCCDELVK